MRILALLLLALPALAVVDGVVVNETAGKPQPGAQVTLFRVGNGMESLGTTKTDASGRFSFDHTPDGPRLLQVVYEGVTYNSMIPPGQPSSGMTLTVYSSTRDASAAEVSQHMILLEPTESAVIVNESFFIVNQTRSTYDDPANGTLRFYLPAAANGDVRVTINEPQAIIPLQRPAEKTNQRDVYKVNFPIKPGETRFDLAYQLPATSTYASRILHKSGPTRIVVPHGVSLTGDSIRSLGAEPRTQATVYDVLKPDFEVGIQGTGTLRSTVPEEEEEESGPGIQQIQPRIHERMTWILGLGLAILGLGFILMYRRTPAQTAAPLSRERRASRK